MGFEHERIHLETSSVLIRQLPIHMVSKPPSWKYGPLKLGKQIYYKMLNKTLIILFGII